MKVLALDLGSKRIGIATANTDSGLAFAHSVLERTGSLKSDHQRIAALVAEEAAMKIVVGLPIDLKGKEGVAAQNVLSEVAQLSTVMGVPVETYDERMTSAAANKNLAAMGVNSKKRRTIIDKYAAAEILQGWLDSQPKVEARG